MIAGAPVLGAARWLDSSPHAAWPRIASYLHVFLLCPLVSGLDIIRVPAFVHALQLVLVVRSPALHLTIASNPSRVARHSLPHNCVAHTGEQLSLDGLSGQAV